VYNWHDFKKDLFGEPEIIPEVVEREPFWGDITPSPNRLQKWEEFRGNSKAKGLLQMTVKVAEVTNKPMRNILLSGYPGTGKTTLANIIAAQSNSTIILKLGSSLKNENEIIKVMMEIEDRQQAGEKVILFIDEIHNLGGGSISEDQFFYLLEEGHFPHNKRGDHIKVNGQKFEITTNDYCTPERFPIIGATTDLNLLHPALQSRFEIQVEVEPYTIPELAEIIISYAEKKEIKATEEASNKIAAISRFIPRKALATLKLANDYAISVSHTEIGEEEVKFIQSLQGITDEGLLPREITLLKILADRDKPMGGASLAASAGMSEGDYKLNSEPYLLHPLIRYIIITPRGRMITEKGKEIISKYEND